MKESLSTVFMNELKNQGLELGEEAAKLIIKAVFKTMKSFADQSGNSFVKKGVALVLVFEDEVLSLVDKIDGKQGFVGNTDDGQGPVDKATNKHVGLDHDPIAASKINA